MLLLLVAVVRAALQFWYLAHIVWWTRSIPASTSFMRVQLERLREQDPQAVLRHQWVPYERISPNLKRAVIAAEDANFTEHDGVDWDAIERAYEATCRKGKVVRGGSTITMQLAKNLFLSGSSSYLRKAQELAITYMLEAVIVQAAHPGDLPERRRVGRGRVRLRGGARATTTACPAPGSIAAQAARLAAMLPRPRFYDRNRGSAALARSAAIVQRWMWDVVPPR